MNNWDVLLADAQAKGLSATELSRQTGVAKCTVMAAAKVRGIHLRDALAEHNAKQKAKWLAVFADTATLNISLTEVARRIGCSKGTVFSAANRYGISHGRQDSRDWHKILLQAKEQGFNQADVVRQEAVSKSTVSAASSRSGIELTNRSLEPRIPRPLTPQTLPSCPEGSVAIALTKGAFTYLDTEDAESAARYCLGLTQGYATRKERGKIVYLHKEIMPVMDGYEIDHVNRNRLDNRKCNLRQATIFDNRANVATQKRNTSGFRGVFFRKGKQGNRWHARIRHRNTVYFLGAFNDRLDAARAYKAATIRLNGEFAYFDDPDKA